MHGLDPILAAALALLGKPYATTATGLDGRLNCSVFAAAVLAAAYPRIDWRAYRSDLMILDARRPWSPVAAVTRAGIGTEDVLLHPGKWHLCQGWRRLDGGEVAPGARGHTFLFWGGGVDHILESTPLDVPWFRAQGWDAQRAKFDEVRFAVLEAA